MAFIGRTTAVGVFTDRALAERAMEELNRDGFQNEHIGFVALNDEVARETLVEVPASSSLPNTATGAVGGGIIGGVLGATAALLIPGFGPAIAGGILLTTLGTAAIGAIAGGFVGSLTSMGVPEDEAHYYQEQLAKGRTIVTVNAPGRYEEAAALLRECGSFDATVRSQLPAVEVPTAAGSVLVPPEPVSTDSATSVEDADTTVVRQKRLE